MSIVPLMQNAFTNSKSELKFFEAAIVDTITVATPTYTYSRCIRQGENGFLCHPGEWFSTLERIYQDRVDVPSIVKTAHEDALSHYAPENVAPRLEAAYDELLCRMKK